MLSDRNLGEVAAMRLADLLAEIEELERGRIALLKRVEEFRSSLQASGQRTAAMRASIDLLCEHLGNVTAVVSELRVLEDELKEAENALDGDEKLASALQFETGGLQDALDEAETELEKISSILTTGKTKSARGH
jgi:hypothetical protein